MRVLIVACFALASALPAAAQDFDSGLAAFARRDYAAALQAWRPLAERGVAAAQYRLGLMYSHGIGVERSFRTARQWYEQAARQGDARAAYEIGVFHELGRGVWQDEREAARWFRQGARAGHGPSQEKFSRYERFLRKGGR